MISADNAKALAILAGVAVLAFVAHKLYRGGVALGDAAYDFVTETANPFSDQNAVYRAFETSDPQTGEVTGTLGTDVYDAFHHSDGSFKWPWTENKPT